MPSLGADMEAGRVTEWLVKVGDEVKGGDIVAVVETEKSTIEVEIFESGVIETIVVPVGEEVPVGTVLARVRSGASDSPEPRGSVAASGESILLTEPISPDRGGRWPRPWRLWCAHPSCATSPPSRASTSRQSLAPGRAALITRHDVERALAAAAASARSGAGLTVVPTGGSRAWSRPQLRPGDRARGRGDRDGCPEARCAPTSTGRGVG